MPAQKPKSLPDKWNDIIPAKAKIDMKKKPFIPKLFLAMLIFAFSAKASNAQVHHTRFLISGVTIHTGLKTVIENGAVGVENGIITYVGPAAGAPATYPQTIVKTGMDLYPGLIGGHTTLGLTEIGAVRATHDFRETGSMNPNVRAISAYNAESDIVATVRANGVLFAQIVPRGGVFEGTSSIVKLDGWNWEDAAYHTDEGIAMNWPKMYKQAGSRNDPHSYKPDEKYDQNLREIITFFERAQAYAKNDYPLHTDLRMEAMRGVFNGNKRLYVNADFIKEIREIVAFKRRFDIPKLTIIGGEDAWMVTSLLNENGISLMIGRVNSLPRFSESPIDGPFTLAQKLAAGGVKFCFDMDGGMETMQNRNLPFNVGTAIGYGLDPEIALQAVTLNAAEIFGIADRTGSIETGKEANFVISKGDIFDMRSSLIDSAYLLGKPIDLNTRQNDLYRKYMGKLNHATELGGSN